MSALAPWPYPRLCAHRGAGKLAPENTLAAFRRGHAFGYRMIECDAKLSADGVAFLLHDATLERTTNGTGRADALPWRELSQLDAGGWHSAPYAGEPLPTLAAVARWCRSNDVALNIEIKPVPGRERETGAAIALDAKTLWGDAAVPPVLSSFAEAALEGARLAVPDLPRAWLVERIPTDWRERAAALGCIALDVKHTELDEARVREIRGIGLRLATWTANDPARVRELRAWQVDTVITDAVDIVAATPT
ncbi:MAG TPA: glycerophosphodiester phosphodiesterase [Casimicrobiaceae bacterium]|jgi:glycerophosphoryl diester phosphodiesterase|nr:glycerophosphodiester phosphodiesterase [Casimicrobiaceae bacterium]